MLKKLIVIFLVMLSLISSKYHYPLLPLESDSEPNPVGCEFSFGKSSDGYSVVNVSFKIYVLNLTFY